MPKGSVRNHSSRTLWVVETDTGTAVAHLLEPSQQSPSSVDADGFKAVDGTPIDGHTSWVKIRDISTADVRDSGTELTRGCMVCSSVTEFEFGTVRFDRSPGWGRPL